MSIDVKYIFYTINLQGAFDIPILRTEVTVIPFTRGRKIFDWDNVSITDHVLYKC